MNGNASTTDSDIGANQSDIDAVKNLQLAIMQQRKSEHVRGQHPKQHGCVRAQFEVLADFQDRLKVGLFKKPMTYTAYVRFSNGKQADDTQPDVHGMAVKLTGVPDRKILDDEATHDFILADNPVFPIRTADEYVQFVKSVAESAKEKKPPERFIAWLQQNRPEDLPVLKGFLGGRLQESPLSASYWSEVPYAFGAGDGTICRYRVKPEADNLVAQIAEAERSPDYLRQVMVEHLTRRNLPARFDFTLQVLDGATAEVIDNPTVEWNVPEQRVAIITIPPQTFDTPEKQAFGENLSYTPWHALHEHRPVGQMNAVRKTVYLESSKRRHEIRLALRGEPTGNEDWG